MTGSYLGVDIGGTKVGVRYESGPAILEARADWPAAGGVVADLMTLSALIERTADEWGRPIDAIGVAVPGTVDAKGELLAWPGRPSWVGMDFPGALRTVFQRDDVRWADDGDLGALAEARHAGCDDLVYLGVGTGVGGGIVIGGRVLPGFARGSCELGHVVVDLEGPVCDCGRRGCVQSFAGGPAVLRRAAALRDEPTTPDELRTAWAGSPSTGQFSGGASRPQWKSRRTGAAAPAPTGAAGGTVGARRTGRPAPIVAAASRPPTTQTAAAM